jgi:hypothetical protein
MPDRRGRGHVARKPMPLQDENGVGAPDFSTSADIFSPPE